MNNRNAVNNWVDCNKLETIICLEEVLKACYQTLAGMIHNNTIRKEFCRFEQHTQNRLEVLRRIFPVSQESKIAIENKHYDYLLMLKPPYLSLSAVINLAVNLTEQKIDIYRYFSLKDREGRELLNQFIEDSKQDLIFLCRERNFHQNIMADAPLKVSLN